MNNNPLPSLPMGWGRTIPADDPALFFIQVSSLLESCREIGAKDENTQYKAVMSSSQLQNWYYDRRTEDTLIIGEDNLPFHIHDEVGQWFFILPLNDKWILPEKFG